MLTIIHVHHGVFLYNHFVYSVIIILQISETYIQLSLRNQLYFSQLQQYPQNVERARLVYRGYLFNSVYVSFKLFGLSSGQTLGVKAQRFRGHTSPHRNVKEKKKCWMS
eukprot:TRINITY_DN2029_c0_g2_i2.p4 TRINITY_DN2029_c0_g2~~TRINITY_DN2029_c0_g2_i2.p4  ORF type:complete len:109 (+),score=8.29 TRINITY_DN2029_c0_g2_i2:389-715(+)